MKYKLNLTLIILFLCSAFLFTTNSSFAVTCSTTHCTCSGDDDCDALFTSTKCKSGTAVVDDDDDGQCEKARATSIPKTVNKVKSLSSKMFEYESKV